MQFVISITVMQYASVYVSCSCLEVSLLFTNKTKGLPQTQKHAYNKLSSLLFSQKNEQTDPLCLTNLKLTKDNKIIINYKKLKI